MTNRIFKTAVARRLLESCRERRCGRALMAVALAVLCASCQGVAPASAYQAMRTPDGKPDLNGIWQVFNTAAWDLQDHSAQAGVPAGQSVVEGNDIPYQGWAAAKKKANQQNAAKADPLSECFLPGVPRVTYLPYPFQIAQTPNAIAILYEWSRTTRIVYTDGTKHPDGLEFWMGDSRGHWEGETLVVDVSDFNDRTWFDRAGNFHGKGLHVVERYTRTSTDHISYEVTIEDPAVFTRPWKMSMLLYRRAEKNLRILEYECLQFLEEQRYKP